MKLSLVHCLTLAASASCANVAAADPAPLLNEAPRGAGTQTYTGRVGDAQRLYQGPEAAGSLGTGFSNVYGVETTTLALFAGGGAGFRPMDLLGLLQRGAPLLLALAAMTGVLCIGTLFAVNWLAGRARWMADTPEIARLALSLFARWTVPCFVMSTVAAAGWLEGAHPERAHDPIVLAAAAATLVLVVVHFRVAARARRLAAQ